MKLSNEHLELAELLNSAGKMCYISGGAVRDSIMNLEARDIDFNTDATPIEIIKIFHGAGWRLIPDRIQDLADAGKFEQASNTKDFGIEFGMLRVRHPTGQEFYELTTFRSEQQYEGRKPIKMTFENRVTADLSRRDLTINSVAYDPISKELVDPYNGIQDIKDGILRTVGNPVDRMREDPLRMLRVIRFMARFGFDIDPVLSQAMKDNAEYLNVVSQERFSEELLKLMKQTIYPSVGIDMLRTHGLLDVILPELVDTIGIPQPSNFHKFDVYGHSLEAMDSVPQSKPFMRLVALLHDIAKPVIYRENAEAIENDICNNSKSFPWFKEHERVGADMVSNILKRLKFSNKEVNRASHLVLNHMRIGQYKTLLDSTIDSARKLFKARRFIRKLVGDRFDVDILTDLFILNRADLYGSGMMSGNKFERFLVVDEFEKLINEELNRIDEKEIIVPVNGHDIMQSLNVPPSPLINDIKEFVSDLYIDDMTLTKDELLDRARDKFKFLIFTLTGTNA